MEVEQTSLLNATAQVPVGVRTVCTQSDHFVLSVEEQGEDMRKCVAGKDK